MPMGTWGSVDISCLKPELAVFTESFARTGEIQSSHEVEN